jgi:hypothetical protein
MSLRRMKFEAVRGKAGCRRPMNQYYVNPHA